MKKIACFCALLAFLLIPIFSLSSDVVIVRDPQGRVVEKRVTTGKVTKVYDKHGKLIRTEKNQ